MASASTFSLQNTTKAKLPSLAFVKMKNAVLGKDYTLSVVIIGRKEMHALNLRTRGVDKPTDILSFPLSDTEGEMFINPECSREKAKEFERSYENFIAFLFIHGLVHLKGFDHGSIMDAIEKEFQKKFHI